jgi:phenylpropionate dioxygenase-like ring-hydroxylating dioxygenase large terminal subunit
MIKIQPDNLYLCLDRDLKENEYQAIHTFGQDVIAKRIDGQIKVKANKCLHRGFKVAQGCGKGEIVCPYHGQPFSFKSPIGDIPSYQVEGFVFLYNFLRLEDRLRLYLRTIYQDLGDEVGHYTQTVDAPFYLWVQNTADPNHLKTVHGDGFAKMFKSNEPYNVEIGTSYSSYHMRVKEEVLEKYKRYKKYMGLSQSSPFFDSFFHMIVMPHLSITSFLGVFYSIETATEKEGKTEVHTRFFDSRLSKVPKPLSKMAVHENIKILAEDKDIIERWAKSHKFDDESQWMQGEERIKNYIEGLKKQCHEFTHQQ